MRKRLFYPPLAFFCLFTSLLAQSQLQKAYLHPKAVGSEKQSKFIDSIHFIPLEINKEVELSTYSSLQVTKNHFMIGDYYGKRIFLFSKDGRFIKKISYKKLGEGFYPNYDEHHDKIEFLGSNKNYTLTKKDKLKIMLDWQNPRNRKYFKKYVIDLSDPSLAIKKNIPEENDIIEAEHYYDNYYWRGKINTSELYNDSLDYELTIYQNNKLVKSFFPYNHINELRYLFAEEHVVVSEANASNIHFVTRPFCDTIYKMINDSLFPVCQLVLPLENSLPASFFTKPFKNKTDRDNFNRNNGWAFHQVYGFYETPQFIYFSVGYLSNYDSYIYQKQNNLTYKTKNIKPDSSQYNLKVLDDYGLTRQNGRFYKSQKAGDLVTFFAQNKNVEVPKELEDFLKGNPHTTAPVIVEFKLKN